MSGIPVYTSSPINAAKKPTAVTPQTTALPPSQVSGGSTTLNPTPSTMTSMSKASYQPAQPGTPAFPAPTGAAAQRYAPLQPTPTTKHDTDNGPPPPQPGPVATMSSIPPPPKSGEKYHPPPQQTSAPKPLGSLPQPYPPQMAIPPPSEALGGQPHRSTPTTNASSFAHPVSLPFSTDEAPRRSLEHPPGYHQNVYASELTSDRRRAMEANNNSTLRGNFDRVGGEDDEGVWNTLGKMASQAGTKIAETEAGIWRSINKER